MQIELRQSGDERGGDSRIVLASPGEYAERFNRNSFQFRHALAGHPLFELPQLADLSERLSRRPGQNQGVFWRSNDVDVKSGWKYVPPKDGPKTAADAIRNLATSESWLLLYAIQSDPVYRELLEQIFAELEAAAELRKSQITWRDAYLFLASPHSLTPYHFDHEVTCLFQIHGERTARVWDPGVLTQEETENYYLGSLSAAIYREEDAEKAAAYRLSPGVGVHHPNRAPHAYQSSDVYSVAMGVFYFLRDDDRRARVYQVNGCLRRLGLRPTPPGSSGWRDRTKAASLGLFSTRHPKTKNDVIRSGIDRLATPFRLLPRLLPKK